MRTWVGSFEKLLTAPLPWTKMRQAQALLRLCDLHGAARVDVLCSSAIAFEVYEGPRIERLLKQAQHNEHAGQGGLVASLARKADVLQRWARRAGGRPALRPTSKSPQPAARRAVHSAPRVFAVEAPADATARME
ncbi:MAG TPA: hypothetical protein VFH51_15875 [Myxococcota bacterium]|nr:hypothetical protein [Myxococcota bacterium]